SSARSRRSRACSRTGRARPRSLRRRCARNSGHISARSSGSSPPSTRSVTSRLAIAVLGAALALAAGAAAPPVPAPRGSVTDLAHVIPPANAARIAALATELRDKTGAEIAVVTVETTAPLDDFTYALRVAEAWKPGRKSEDTGVVFLVAVRDRKLRILV